MSDADPVREPAGQLIGQLTGRYGIDPEDAATLAEYGFDPDTFDRLRASLLDGTPADRRLDRNRIAGALVEPLRADDVAPLPEAGSPRHRDLAEEGSAAIAAGEVAVLLLAGGMATRFGGGVKALAEVLDGLSFVDAKLADVRRVSRSVHAAAGRAAEVTVSTIDKKTGKIDLEGGTTYAADAAAVPLWLMTSFRSDAALRRWAVGAARAAGATRAAGPDVGFAPQSVSMRLRPDGGLFRCDGRVSLYAPGHGDVGWALRRSGLLDDFAAGGGKHVFVGNVDNVAATLDPAVIGAHRRLGRPLTCEIAAGSEVGGAPWRVDGKPQIVEAFRLPRGAAGAGFAADPAAAVYVNTNSLVADVEVLAADHPLSWFEVHKQVDGADVVQFERLVGELSAFVDTTMLLVERDG
ncbi:MAG TPA: hypothetical protein DEP69_06425, partial [Acidimicrobiaceae bacterium]|nr:hypothetical protein [Acidimicrobiaceae bacterium]